MDPESNAVECDSPTSETWPDPEPDRIKTLATPPLTTWITPLEAVPSTSTKLQSVTIQTTGTSTLSSLSETAQPPTSLPPLSSQPADLSKDAKAGIGVGVACVGLAILGLLVFYARRGHGQKKRGIEQTLATRNAHDNMVREKAELPPTNVVHEAYAPLAELSGLRDAETRFEMPADSTNEYE